MNTSSWSCDISKSGMVEDSVNVLEVNYSENYFTAVLSTETLDRSSKVFFTFCEPNWKSDQKLWWKKKNVLIRMNNFNSCFRYYRAMKPYNYRKKTRIDNSFKDGCINNVRLHASQHLFTLERRKQETKKKRIENLIETEFQNFKLIIGKTDTTYS